ncbi:unnamed protein product, partial [Candidula unifasciata]
VVKHLRRRFHQSLSKCDISWTCVTSEGQTRHAERVIKGISDRFSHSAVYYDGSMYVFGGCTSTNTTFNDLWRLDLTTRQWIRPIAMGTYPSPKACATMVEYNGNLVLFGGWSHPIPYPLHQSAHYFSELHVYSTVTNRWSHVLSIGQEPEALGGHSASVAGHLMVIFGGSPRPGLGTNNLWVFNFLKASWMLQPVTHAKPEPRYGQFQTTLDEQHILIMGGCVGQNRVYSDLWLLTLHATDPWQWTRLTIRHPELAAPQTWCHAACRVKDTIVVVARSSKVRQTRTVKPDTPQRSPHTSDWSSSDSSCSSTDSSPLSPKSLKPQLSPKNELQNRADYPDDPEGKEAERVAQPNSKLLSLQQQLHRDCMNLPDPNNHHHRSHVAGDDAEGYFHRISNRWGNEQGASQHHQNSNGQMLPLYHPQQHEYVHRPVLPSASLHHPQPHEYVHRPLILHTPPPQNADQPQFGSLQRLNNNHLSSGRSRGSMPSIRPNAMNNRQKQLEALQRQEELLRSKSRALAASRIQRPNDQVVDASAELVPEVVSSRNKMDMHVLDISRVLTDGVAEWRPLSELQPNGAPTETICCSILEGRGELMLFGGVIRNQGSPVVTNTAVNKLYLLQPY